MGRSGDGQVGSAVRPRAERIVRVLRGAGHIAYFAGGCVRDELLGLNPEDYDVATDATPQRVVELFPGAGEVGKSFGVVIVKGHGGRGVWEAPIEVATFRSDGPYSDRRRPDSIRFSTPEEDALRRDYTVNALFLDPFDDAPGDRSPLGGRVIDYVGGLADLRKRVLRAVGDAEQRLAEDHLRALRAARLAAKLGFEIDPATAAAIRGHASELRGVSRERIGEEVRRLLAHPSRAQGVGLVESLGLSQPVLLADGGAVAAGVQHLRVAGLSAASESGVALAAWLLDLGEPLEEPTLTALLARLRRALCLSNEEHHALAATLRCVRTLRSGWDDLRVARRKRLASSEGFAPGLILFTLENPWRGGEVRGQMEALASTYGGLAPPPLLDGQALIALGFQPGPGFKRTLDAVYDAQLEGVVATPEAARELARRMGV